MYMLVDGFLKVFSLKIPALGSISEQCLNYNAYERPVTNDLYTFLMNLLSSFFFYRYTICLLYSIVESCIYI